MDKTTTYYIEYYNVHSNIRAKKILRSDDYILSSTAYISHVREHQTFNTDGINLQSLVIKVDAKDYASAELIAKNRKYEIASYLAGIFQVSFFFLDSGFDYSIFGADPIPYREKFKHLAPLMEGKQISLSLGSPKKYSVIVEELPNFDQYKAFRDIFYLWRSASDDCNELGWRFLNYFRIIELLTKKSFGSEKKNKNIYEALPEAVKEVVIFSEFQKLVNKWRNPTAHDNIPNAVIPTEFHGQFHTHPDILKLFEMVRLLIKNSITLSVD